ncbi:MAG: sensor histidine kinase [Deltaproteobacteria bacterium]|nr:sensor histidine kinase [Deltaproteobacteria bacterium]
MKQFRYYILVIVVIGIGLLHFFTPGHLIFYHDTYRRLSYFPIALGGIWFGVRGGISLAAMTSVAFIPHLLLFVGKGLGTYLSELTEIVLYLAAGVLIGAIAGRESKLREKYRLLSEKLKKSYRKLHEETELLVEVEEQLRLSQKLSTLGQLSSSLAHEVKNPLGSIKGTAEIIMDDYPKDHPKREFVEILMAETSRLDSSVNEVLQFFRGRPSADPDVVMESLDQVLARVSKLFSNELEKKKIGITLKGIELSEEFQVAGEKVSQIFINLILNAMDAIQKGGMINVRIRQTAGGMNIQVHDSGPGISLDARGKIFDPFYTNKEDGTGLGLPISRKIAESYGGDIRLLETESGACFEVFFPDNPHG